MQTFRSWIETQPTSRFANYGFQSRKLVKPVKPNDDKPIVPLHPENVTEALARHAIGPKKGRHLWASSVQWGENTPGAIRLDFSPLGSFKVVIRRLISDLKGVPSWICEEVVDVRDNAYHEESLTFQLIEDVTRIEAEPMERPLPEYDLDRLARRLAHDLGSLRTDIMLFDKLVRFTPFRYHVTFAPRGFGVEAPGHMRLEQFVIVARFNPVVGLINIVGETVQSPAGGRHSWIIQPAEWDEIFAPTQAIAPISKMISEIFVTF